MFLAWEWGESAASGPDIGCFAGQGTLGTGESLACFGPNPDSQPPMHVWQQSGPKHPQQSTFPITEMDICSVLSKPHIPEKGCCGVDGG